MLIAELYLLAESTADDRIWASLDGLVPIAALIIWLLRASRGAKAASANPRAARSDPDSLPGRHVRAREIAAFVAVIFFIAVCALATILAMAAGQGGGAFSPGQRAELVVIGGITMSLWIFAAVYGIVRLIMRLRSGPARNRFR
jgi:hypothetical protein